MLATQPSPPPLPACLPACLQLFFRCHVTCFVGFFLLSCAHYAQCWLYFTPGGWLWGNGTGGGEQRLENSWSRRKVPACFIPLAPCCLPVWGATQLSWCAAHAPAGN